MLSVPCFSSLMMVLTPMGCLRRRSRALRDHHSFSSLSLPRRVQPETVVLVKADFGRRLGLMPGVYVDSASWARLVQCSSSPALGPCKARRLRGQYKISLENFWTQFWELGMAASPQLLVQADSDFPHFRCNLRLRRRAILEMVGAR